MKNFNNESYHFADFIRFVAMCAIIFQHSFLVNKNLLNADTTAFIAYFSLKIMAKIGSISFFIVSGFLFSEALERYTGKEYLKKRFTNILWPYIIFVSVFALLEVFGAFFGEQKIETLEDIPKFIISKVFNTLFYTSYWFIFNYFISLLVLLALKKFLYRLWLGVVLLSFTLIYSLNVYLEIFPAHHTTAIFGFTFFLWLGANFSNHKKWFWGFVNSISIPLLVILMLMLLAANIQETMILYKRGAEVIDSSLKISNILYALCVYFFLIKISPYFKFKWLNPRDETYPLYLVHPIVLKIIFYGIIPLSGQVFNILTIKSIGQVSAFRIIILQLIWFVLTYVITIVVIKFIFKTRFSSVFGVRFRKAVETR